MGYGVRGNVDIKVPTFTTVDVPPVGILVLAANTQRFFATIQNLSDTNIWIYFGSQNIVGQGLMIPKNGFSFEIDRLNLWKGTVYAIHGGSGDKSVAVLDCQ